MNLLLANLMGSGVGFGIACCMLMLVRPHRDYRPFESIPKRHPWPEYEPELPDTEIDYEEDFLIKAYPKVPA